MLLQSFVVGQLQANCYAVGDEESREVLVIDPGDQGPALLEELAKRELRVVGRAGHALPRRPLGRRA